MITKFILVISLTGWASYSGTHYPTHLPFDDLQSCQNVLEEYKDQHLKMNNDTIPNKRLFQAKCVPISVRVDNK